MPRRGGGFDECADELDAFGSGDSTCSHERLPRMEFEGMAKRRDEDLSRYIL